MFPREGAAVTAEVTALTPGAPQDRDISGFWALFQRSGHRSTNRKRSGEVGGGMKIHIFVCQQLELWEGGHSSSLGRFW